MQKSKILNGHCNRMTLLVTGTTGYIGREFIRKYQNQYTLVALVRTTSDISKIEKLNCKIEKADNFEAIERIFQKYTLEGIIHFASNVLVEHGSENIDGLIQSNITYGTSLLELSKRYNLKWFLNTGTFWQNFESEEYNPVNLYAATKEAFQTVAKYYTQTSSLIFTTIKLNDTFGANDTRPKIFNLWDKFSQSGEILHMSKGEQIIDISYIEDILNAFNSMIQNFTNEDAQIFNNKSYIVTSNARMSLQDLAKVFERTTKRKLNIVWGGRAYREREVMNPLEKAEIVPHWKQKYTLQEAILKTIGEIK